MVQLELAPLEVQLSFQLNKMKMAEEKKSKKIEKVTVRAVGKDLPISTKHAVALCAAVKRKNIRKANELLRLVILKKTAVPMKGEIPHHPIGATSRPSRYPMKAAEYFTKLLKDLAGNAAVKGLDIESLIITAAIANKASRPYRATRLAYGRKRLKRTHIRLEAEAELIVKKTKEKKKEKPEEKKIEESQGKGEAPLEEKPVEKKETKPEEKIENKKEK